MIDQHDLGNATNCIAATTGSPAAIVKWLIALRHAVRTQRRLFMKGVAIWCATLYAYCSFAAAPTQRLADMTSTCWTTREGAPAGVFSMEQTPDGYLWLGTQTGLYRFDGVHFELLTLPDGSNPIVTDIVFVYVSAGELWAGSRYGDIFRIREGRVTHFAQREGLPPHAVWQIAQRPDGSMWAQTQSGLYFWQGSGLWKRAGADWDYPVDDRPGANDWGSLLVDREGTLWARSPLGIFFLRPDARRFTRASAPGGSGSLFLRPNGELWVADSDSGILNLSRPSQSISAKSLGSNVASFGGTLFDRQGALWTTMVRDEKFATVRIGNVDAFLANGNLQSVETRLPAAAGQCSFYSNYLFEDREGNIWRPSPTGIDRFRTTRFQTVTSGQANSIRHAPMTTDRDGTVWIASRDYILGFPVGQFEPIRIAYPQVFDQEVVQMIRDPDGSFIFGSTAHGFGLTRFVNGTPGNSRRIDVDSQAMGLEIHRMVRDSAGSLWISTIQGGLSRQNGDTWIRNGGMQLPAEPPFALEADADGHVFAGYRDGRLALIQIQATRARMYDTTSGLDVGPVLTIAAGSNHRTWIGGDKGVALLIGDRFHTLQFEDSNRPRNVSGLVEDKEGGIWMNCAQGIMHVDPRQISAFSQDPNYRAHQELFNYEDGIDGVAETIRPVPTAVLGGDGRVWFATSAGVYWIDPRKIPRNPVAPQPAILTIVADGKSYSASAPVTLPKLTRNFQIGFTAPSFLIPDRLRFEYMLEGVDRSWQSSKDNRQAAYTNVPPGTRTFNVKAANEDGVWSVATARIAITVPPAFYQTTWFYALAAFAIFALLWQAVQIRLRQVAGRLQERAHERERIARELHDTLIQSAIGLIMTFQGWMLQLKEDDPKRRGMLRALEMADQLVKDARSRVMQLRAAEHQGDLVGSIGRAGHEIFTDNCCKFSVSCTGAVRPLQAIAAEEIFAIAREAMSNARQHAAANVVEVEITFARDAFRMSIRDNGTGFAPELLAQAASSGHLGIQGMRERAKLIGARFRVFSGAKSGVEVEVEVSAAAAYIRDVPDWRAAVARWLSFTRRPARHG